MFDLYLTDKSASEFSSSGTGKAVFGKICIGAFTETFFVSLELWNSIQYKEHWKTALQRLTEGADRSVLITSYNEPPGRFLMCWPLYRENETIFVQNQMLFFDQLDMPFSVKSPWASIQPRKITDDDGRALSEWTLSLDSIREYLNRNQP